MVPLVVVAVGNTIVRIWDIDDIDFEYHRVVPYFFRVVYFDGLKINDDRRARNKRDLTVMISIYFNF